MTAPAQQPQAGIGAWSGNRTAPFRNGSWGVRATDRRIVAAWAVDLLVVLVPVIAVAASATKGSGSIGAGIFVGITVWLLFPWFYGFCCAGGNTLGTLLAGTRLVKLRDGSAPGFWRNGWLMFLRTVLFPLMPLNAVLNSINGVGSETERKHHVSIDKAETKALHQGRS
ncbi:RDD family protein [Arthrobacter sp. TWP1-1]|uniref:RDD family protein n=1 Tax=Arthrobacter sp. TWP1-1 TaxID=2804568 RepID=UPI003CEED2C2